MQSRLALALLAATFSSAATANTVTQNLSWTINRSGTKALNRVVAYGDSIFAGYHGSISDVAKRASPYVDAEYAQKTWNSSIELYRRTKSGAVASDIYNNKIVAEASYMQATDTRIVMFEMCGNDFLQARSNFKNQTGTCDYSGIDSDGKSVRYVLLESLREYALERLTETGELEEACRSHALYYLALAERADPELLNREQRLWIDRLERARENIRTALRWLIEHDRMGK